MKSEVLRNPFISKCCKWLQLSEDKTEAVTL